MKNNVIITISLCLILFICGGLTGFYFFGDKSGAVRSATTALTQVINPGTLSVDIVDASYASVSSPSVAMAAQSFSFACSSSTGTLGTSTQQIYVKNPDAADSGWSLTIAASAPTAFWNSAGTDYDFNDATSSGCGDGADADTLIGQMTINPSAGTLAKGACSTCGVTNISKGTSASFVQSTTDSITLLTAASGSDDIGDWTLQGATISQTLPAELPAASDYTISLTVTVTAL